MLYDFIIFLKSFLVVVVISESEPGELMKKPWFIGVMIGTICGMLWLILCIFTIWLCKRRKNKKKMKDQRYYTGGMLNRKSKFVTCQGGEVVRTPGRLLMMMSLVESCRISADYSIALH